MSATGEINRRDFVSRYVTGSDRYVKFSEEILGVRLAEVQKKILRSVEENQRVVIVSGNGVGKSFVVACLNLSFLYTNNNATVVATSGSYTQLTDATFKPMTNLLEQAQGKYSFLPGKTLKAPPRIEFDGKNEQFFKAISPRNPGGLEGRHNDSVLVVCDEADKPEMTMEHFDSAASSITDGNDRMVVIANPPEDESNSVVQLMENDRYETIQFSSFDSHNVKVDAGEIDDSKIKGLVDLELLKEDWKDWNDTEWIGYEAAKHSADRDGLDTRWYRRRLGIIPPDNAASVRPFQISSVISAENRYSSDMSVDSVDEYEAIGIDVARGGGDRTVIAGVTEDTVDILLSVEEPDNHQRNKALIESTLGEYTNPVIMDAVGEGSALADWLENDYSITRFSGGANAKQKRKYYDKRTEALAELGQWLGDGAIEPKSSLSLELRACARNIELKEKSLRGGQTFKATSKSELKKGDSLGRSPDLLDAASLAVYGRNLVSTTRSAGYSFYSYED